MNINQEIFKRYQPEKKLAIIEDLSDNEVLAITKATIIRILKEVGVGYFSDQQRNSNKHLRLKHHVGNNWNSDVERFSYYKKKLYVDFYLQYDNTDTTIDDTYDNFMRYSEYRGSYEYEDRYGGTQTTYFRYDPDDKARVLRELLCTYVYIKYADKLGK